MAGGNGSDRLDRIEKILDDLAQQQKTLLGRHEALVERHEALTQTVEIIAGMQRAGEERMAMMEEQIAKTHTLIAQSLEAINALARIAESHERRLGDLEGGH